MENDYNDSMCPAERMFFYALCYRYQEYEDDECWWWDFREFFKDTVLDELQTTYKDEELSLQEKKVVVFSTRDGMVVKDRFKIDDPVKEELLADCGGGCMIIPTYMGFLSMRTFRKRICFTMSLLERVSIP